MGARPWAAQARRSVLDALPVDARLGDVEVAKSGAEKAPSGFEARPPLDPSAEPLAGGQLDLWAVRVDRCSEQDWARLNPKEVARAERLLIERKRVQQVASRSALRAILSGYLGGDPRDIEFSYGAHDKPSVEQGGLSFNLSHSGCWALLGVASQGKLGVDVEEARDKRAFVEISERFFSAPERAALSRLQGDAQRVAFYRAWTRKEAYLKAWGTGLTFASSRFCVDFGPNTPGRVLHSEMPGDEPSQWHFVDLELEPRYPAAVCWDRQATRVRRYAYLG